jgi:phospholipid-transporting ATPase
VLRPNGFEKVLWKQVLVGDIMKVENRSYIPADIVLITTSEPQGLCYIETANLDGETNLKSRQALLETTNILPENFHTLKGTVIKCEQPNSKVNNFDGSIILNDKTYPLSLSQLLLRVCVYICYILFYTLLRVHSYVIQSGFMGWSFLQVMIQN